MLRGLDIQVSGMQSLAKSYTPCCVLGHELLAVVPPQLLAKTIIGDITWDHRPLVSTHYPLHSTQRFLPKGEKILKTLLQQIYGPTLYSQHIQRHRLTFHFGECWIKPSGEGTKCRCYWHNTNAVNCWADIDLNTGRWQMWNAQITQSIISPCYVECNHWLNAGSSIAKQCLALYHPKVSLIMGVFECSQLAAETRQLH